MQIRLYAALTCPEQALLFQCLFGLTPPGFTSQEKMARVLSSSLFDEGQNLLTAWTDQGAPLGTLGVITKDLPVRGEAFLVSPLVSPSDAAQAIPALVEAAYAVVRRAPGAGARTLVRLGIGQARADLRPAVEAAGFRQTYRILWMERSLEGVGTPGLAGLTFQPLDAEYLDEYIRVHNAAFVQSPNGAMASREEVADELSQPDRRPELKQVGLLDGRLAVVLLLTLHDGAMGEVEALAVDPALQGYGLGRAGLMHGLATLKEMGCTRAQLTVVESNSGALRLYESSGFALRTVQSTWFIGPSLAGSIPVTPTRR